MPPPKVAGTEDQANMIQANGVALIPGLLQTPDYARRLFTVAGVTDVEGEVERRMTRQRVLTKDQPPYVSFLLSEVALLLLPPDLVADQLRKLLEISKLPNVTLRLVQIAAGLQPGLEGSFNVFNTSERAVGWVETPARGRLVTDIADLRRLREKFDRTSGCALSPETTREQLQQMIEALNDPMAEVQPQRRR